MDYNTKFNSTASIILKEKETFGRELMLQSSKEGRTFEYVHSALDKAFFTELKNYDLQSPYKFGHLLELLTNFSRSYSTNRFQNALKNEMQEHFMNNYKNKSYPIFVEKLATRFGLRRAYLANKWNFDYSEYIYNNGDFERYTLQLFKKGISNSKMYSSYCYNSKFQRGFSYVFKPNEEDKDMLEKLLQAEKPTGVAVKEKKEKKEDLVDLPSLTEDEKLLLIHYLIRSESLEKVEKVKILALLGNSPISIEIFNQASRDNIQYQEVLKGYKYKGTKKARKTLTSLYKQVEIFKIDNLNSAIKMDLNAIKNEEIKKNLKKK